MKKILKICCILGIFFLFGCGVYSQDDVINDLEEKITSAKSYLVTGTLEIMNNEDTYTYNITVSYQDDDYYKVELVNTTNNHEQVILRNDDGVYVVVL
jgi:outer membrane lipoprotein-sorting protein